MLRVNDVLISKFFADNIDGLRTSLRNSSTTFSDLVIGAAAAIIGRRVMLKLTLGLFDKPVLAWNTSK